MRRAQRALGYSPVGKRALVVPGGVRASVTQVRTLPRRV